MATLKLDNVNFIGSAADEKITAHDRSAAAHGQRNGKHGWKPVATRQYVQTSNGYGTPQQSMCRQTYTMLAEVSALKLVFANWSTYHDQELVGSQAATYNAAIEYPIGTIAGLFTFSGAENGVCDAGENIESDELSISVPVGSKFAIRTWGDYPGGIVTANGFGIGDMTGSSPDALNYGTTAINSYSSAVSVTKTSGTGTCSPIAILGYTNAKCIGIIGDSKAAGSGDTVSDFNGATGEIKRSLASANVIYYDVSSGGSTLQAASAGADGAWAKRIALIKEYCDAAVCQMGANDIINGATYANLISYTDNLKALLGMPLFMCTLAPLSSSTDNFTTTANQSYNSTRHTNRIGFNGKLRAGITRATAVIELADVVESSRDSGLWKADGVTVNLWTTDGVHESVYGYKQIASTKIFEAVIRW